MPECGWFNIGLWLIGNMFAKCFVTVGKQCWGMVGGMLHYGWLNIRLGPIVGSAFGNVE